METLALFMTQFLWFFVVWSSVVYFVVWPWSLQLSEDMRLGFWVAPQMFRALGLGLLVPNLSPGISQAFAIPTAAVDFLTAILALLAFLGLMRGWKLAHFFTWACTLIGLSDLLIAFSIAPFIGVADHLTAQWYIPAFVGPLMIVSHIACLAALLRGVVSKPNHRIYRVNGRREEHYEHNNFITRNYQTGRRQSVRNI